MLPQSGSPISEALPPTVRVHVLGAGPVGLVVTALLQSNDRFSVHLYEKRRDYTRTRMVQLAPYLVADSIASYCADYIDGESVGAIFEPAELEEGLAFRQSIPPDLMGLLRGRTMLVVSHPRNDSPQKRWRSAAMARGPENDRRISARIRSAAARRPL